MKNIANISIVSTRARDTKPFKVFMQSLWPCESFYLLDSSNIGTVFLHEGKKTKRKHVSSQQLFVTSHHTRLAVLCPRRSPPWLSWSGMPGLCVLGQCSVVSRGYKTNHSLATFQKLNRNYYFRSGRNRAFYSLVAKESIWTMNGPCGL